MKKVLHSIILTVMVFVLVPTVQADLTEGLVGYWAFDEGSGGTAYDSANGNDGNILGATWTTGWIGSYAIDFDGNDDYIEVPYNDSLGPGYITMSVWVRPDTVSRNMMLIGKSKYSDCSSEQYAFAIKKGGTPYASIKRNSSCAIGQSWKEAWPSGGIIADQWYLVASTWDGSVFKIYINGELSGTNSSVPAGLIDYCPGGTLRFGIWWSQGQIPFQGVMDDVRIYNRALSDEEIQELYQMAFKPNHLEIIGSNEVAEDSQAQYKAIVVYDNNSTKDVTDTADWAVSPDAFAQIDANGLLETGILNMPTEQVKIYAEYTENEITVSAEKDVSIFANCSNGSALEFDGGDYVNVANSSSLNPIHAITVASWIYAYSNPSDGWRGVVSKDFGQTRQNWKLELAYGQVYWAPTSRDWRDYDISGGPSCIGNWHHLVGVYDTSSGLSVLYVDGAVVASKLTPGGTIVASPGGLRIGDDHYGTGRKFHGIIDDVRIYNKALSAEEIQELMYSRPELVDPNLAAYWDFDEGNGQVVHDLSSNGNNGYLGADPCDVDTADPKWFGSKMPPYRCTREQMIERNLYGALDNKAAATEMIKTALAKEQATNQMLLQIWREQCSKQKGPWPILCKQLGSTKIWRAIQCITQSMTKEYNSMKQLNQSIKDLEDATEILGMNEQDK